MEGTLMAKALDMQMTVNGMVVTVGDDIVSRGAWSDGEIDFQIDRLLVDLETIRKRMKVASRNRKPLSLEIVE
jgi:hypothetical protein